MIKKVAIPELKRKAYYESVPLLSKEEIKVALDESVHQLRHCMKSIGDKFPQSSSVNNTYEVIDNVEWTTGFWTGMLWIAYEYTKDEYFKNVAEKNVTNFLNRIEQNIEVDHHDMGFLYSPSCVAAYKITGNQTGKKAALLAADKLVSRFHKTGNFIQAWGAMGASDNYRLIIDCMLNLPLLHWASKETGDSKYSDIAFKHLISSCNTTIRDDASTFHTYFFDPVTGNPTKGVTHQGYKDDSSWARGQAWGVTGLALNYVYLKDEKLLDLYYGVTNFYLNHCPDDEIAYWDLVFGPNDGHPRDSSASSTVACGLLEMDKYLAPNDPYKKAYLGATHAAMRELIANYTTAKHAPESNGLLLHGVYNWKGPRGVDECTTWGDYFYMEALMRLYTDNKWDLYW